MSLARSSSTRCWLSAAFTVVFLDPALLFHAFPSLRFCISDSISAYPIGSPSFSRAIASISSASAKSAFGSLWSRYHRAHGPAWSSSTPAVPSSFRTRLRQ